MTVAGKTRRPEAIATNTGAHWHRRWASKSPTQIHFVCRRPHEGCILVHTGAAQRVRVWPMERFRNVVQRLRAQGFVVQVACDPNQRDWWIAVGEAKVATPRTITELLQLSDRAAVLIGNDSGPGHLAAFNGLPTFTIFGPQLPERFAPLHPASVWIEGAPCPYRPCSDYCHFSVPHCMWDLTEQRSGRASRNLSADTRSSFKDPPVAVSAAGDERSGRGRIVGQQPGRRRVLHVNNSADIYGASRMLLRFLKTVDQRRFQPLVVLPEEGLLKRLFEAQGVEVVLHPRLSIITRPVF